MHPKAISAKMNEDTLIEVTFQDGMVKQYDMSALFGKYPQLKALEDRSLFYQGRLQGFYGIVWNDDLDIDVGTIYEKGITVRQEPPFPCIAAGDAVLAARASRGMTQKELSLLTGIDQADISRIEKGIANPTVGTLSKIASALDGVLRITIDTEE